MSSLEKQEKHSENTVTTVDIRAEINNNYQLWDNKLNEIYRVLKNNMPANAFETLKSKQIAWIKAKESRVQAIINDPNNGTMALIEADEASYTMTKERCYELVNSYMN
ncbi:lysozyme inhibitor LprI family protein [Bacillus cereus]|uniref:lysozyme inhibitor LprI family protein n=1 Tax=Bacillus cereus TaxID=1396 RepID=UPI003980634F